MANVDGPFGFRPVRMLSGSAYTGASVSCAIAAAYGTRLGVGDPVQLAGSSVDGAPTISRAAAGGPVFGIIVGFEPTRSDLTLQYSPATTAGVAMVCADPNVVFEVQDDGGGALDGDAVGLNADFIAGNCSTSTGRSIYELDGGTTTAPATTADLPLKIVGQRNSPDNDLDADFAVWEVTLNKSELVADATGLSAGI